MGDENQEKIENRDTQETSVVQDMKTEVASNPVADNAKTKSKKKWIIVIIVIAVLLLVLATIGLLIWKPWEKGGENSRQPEQADNSVNSNSPTEECSATSETTSTTADALANVSQNLALAGHNSLNGGELGSLQFNIVMFPNMAGGGISISGPYESQKWTVVVDWDEVKEAFALDTSKTGREWLSDVDLGITGEVIDVFASGFGQAVGDETFFFLMNDGTVEYMPVYRVLKENSFKSYGKLPGIEHVVKMANATSVGFGAGKSAAAIRADGDYYNLYNAIKSTENY